MRALVVDDSALVASTLQQFLQGDGHFEVVGIAENGQMAVSLVAELQPDLVLMDVQMPEMDGLEATRRIKSRPHAPTVFILTLLDTPSCRARAKAAGADGFVSKTELPKKLPRLLARFRKDSVGSAARTRDLGSGISRQPKTSRP